MDQRRTRIHCTYRGEVFAGIYWIDGANIWVAFEGRTVSEPLGCSAQHPLPLARLLLLELVEDRASPAKNVGSG